jgi:amino acid adenylation domain-containing protein
MTDIQGRLAGLSPEKRRLLELRLQAQRAQAAGPALVPRPRGGPLPLSFAQQRLWVLDRLDPGSAAYNMPSPLRLRGALDARALERALDGLRERHEPLRTTFALAEVEGEPVQVIHPFVPTPLETDDLAALPADAREAEVVRRVHADANTGFDLVAGPLFRARLLRLGAEEHVLLLCLHHSVSDGWSIGILARELGALYAAFTAGAPDPLPPLPVQYADFAVWQRAHLGGDVLARHLDFWRGALSGAPPALELPTDRPRPPVESHRGVLLRERVPPELAGRLRALAQAEGATLFAVLLAGLRVVLARWSGQADVVIGTPVAGRTRSEVEGLIGFFINTLPLRGTVDPAEPFRALLRREAAATLRAFDHQELPFERIVEELRIARDLSRNPVFQVSLMLQNARVDAMRLAGVEIAPLEVAYDAARFDLAFDVYEEDGGGLRMETEYATDLFDQATAERLGGHLLRLLDEAAAAPDVPLARLEMIGTAERAMVVPPSAVAARDWPFVPFPRMIVEQAARTPDAVAVQGADGALTYAQLDALSGGVAAALRAAGAGRGSLVAVCLDRSARMVAALLGVLRAGAAYLPLDPEYPADRIAYMLEDSGARVLLAERRTESAVPPSPIRRVLLDDVAPTDGFADVDVDPEELAYVIYTSGSTGRPKGVMVRHGGVSSFLRSMPEAPGLRADDTLLALTTIAFDISVLELFLPLTLGARVAVAAREQAADPVLLSPLVARSGATVVQATPATWAMLLATGWTPRPGTRLLTGGEALPRGTADRLLAAGAELWNMYGPTETTIWSTTGRVPAEGDIDLGAPIANTAAYVLDPSLNAAPLGVFGELYLGGAGVARGYLHRPGLTAERFVPDPFGATGSRLYRTGDRVRRRADGALEFGGRVDFQVKLRGFRIELGEIESALRAHPGVGAAVAIVREDVAGDARLVAYLTARNGDGAPEGPELRAHLRTRLPEYMVPSAFVALDELPLTPNGKVDRKALPAPEGRAEARPYTAPRTPEEQALAEIWREVLRLDRVGLEDDFFELGGHSMLATQVLSRVRRELGVELPLRALFEAGTVRALSERLHGAQAADGPDLVPVPRGGPLPLSFAQERMWFLERMAPETGSYNMPDAMALDGPLDVEALRRALERLVARHEVLRTRYAEVDGQPVSDVQPPPRFHLPVEDVAEADVPDRMRADARAPFDLAAQIPIRARLLRTAPERHVLLLNVHHIAADGWSWGVLMRELTLLYGAAASGKDAPLGDLPIQYADYAAWQHAWLRGAVTERQLAFWRARLDGAPALLELPYDRPRPAEQDERGGVLHAALPAGTVRAARALARAEGATLYMVLLAAWSAVLHRWSGQEDVVVGSPVAGRARPETEGVVGLFVNTLAMRTDFCGDPPFRALLGRVREAALEAYAHQDVPFEKLVQELGGERSTSHAPVFQVMLGLASEPGGQLEMDGVRVRPLPAVLSTARTDLSVMVEEDGDALRVLVEYATALFDRATVARMAEHLEVLLRAAAARPGTPVGALSLLSGQERLRVVEGWNAPVRPAPRDAAVHAEFARVAEGAPHAAALSWDGGTMTYGELHARSSRLANHLRRHGVDADQPVALVMDRSPELVVAVLAILKAGGAYVPVNPADPGERVRMMLDDCGARVLISRAGPAAALPEHGLRAVLVDRDRDAIAAEPAADPRVRTGADGAAYVIYTSGSTGRPKGVVVPHRAVLRLVLNTGYARFAADEVWLQLAPAAFDASTLELWGPLLNGGRLALFPPALPAMEALGGFVQRHGVTAAWLTAGLFHQVVDEGLSGLAGLRQLLAGGDVLSIPHVRRVLDAYPDLRLVNGYGPTENTTFSACHAVGPADAERATIPLGRPIAGTTAYVLDAYGQPLPADVPGELHVGGEGLGRGYLNAPALTAARYVPNPFSPAPGARLYRTGDRVRWRADGTLDFLGRMDQQAKIRGFRIEPGEVEAALGAHPGVRQAAVAVRGDGEARRLVAYVVPVDGSAVETRELRAHAAARLPDYMVPSAWVVLDALPLTPGGKVDRRALPEPAEDGAEARGEGPRGPVEQLLAGLWTELLGTRRVSRGDSFFALGGHSLIATRLVSRIRRALGVELPLKALFAAPTLAALAEQVEAARAAADGTERVPPIRPQPREAEPPLSFAQERMWFLDRLVGRTGAYDVPVVLELRGELDAEALGAALEGVVARHEALRTRITERDGRPVQRIAAPEPFRLPVAGVAEDGLDAALGAETGAGFDLAADLPIRARLFRIDPERHVLALTFHHVAVDGWSIGILLRELAALYTARREGRDAALPPPALQYADFAAWQRRWLHGETLERQMGFWRRQLAGAPAGLELPTDRPRPAQQSYRGALHFFDVPREVGEALAAFTAAEQVTTFMAALAAFAALLGRYAGQDDVVVGSPVAGRHRAEAEPIVGLFVNTLGLRTDLSGDPGFRTLVRRVRETTLDAYAHQDLPFERLADELATDRSLDRTPVFQVMLTVDEAGSVDLRIPGIEARERIAPHRTAKLDLTFNLSDTGGGALVGGFEYATDLFEPSTIARMGDHFVRLIGAALADPDRPLSLLDPATPAERATVAAWEAAPPVEPDPRAFPARFAAQAARAPDAPALVFGGRVLTYGELDARAGRLAGHLRGMGIGVESRVGVCLPRTPELVVALLAVLRTGAAYVSLEPHFPDNRIASVLADAGARALVTTADRAASLVLPAGCTAVPVDDAATAEAIASAPAAEGEIHPHPESLAHILYTSGSTGAPKGVMIRHGSVASLLSWLEGRFPLAPGDRVLASTSIAFDVHVAEVHHALASGATLVLVENALALAELGAEAGIVQASMVPTAAGELLRAGALPGSLRRLNLGGEPVAADLCRALYAAGVPEVHNFYGPTEDTTYSTHDLLPPDGRVTVGRQVAGTRAYVLDGALRPVAVGVPGELYLAGDGTARGYLARPGMTAERFVPDPHGPAGARMYTTGDRARWLADGRLDVLGRSDFQVKVRGYRIELGEVEAALRAHPRVASAAAAGRGEASAGRLVAWVVPAPGGGLEPAELAAFLAERLPDYMVPSAIGFVDAFPLTTSGKVDRNALAEPDRLDAAAVFAEPETEDERALAAVWAELLGLDRVGRDDGFFDRGGHSLLAMQLLSRIRGVLGADLSLRAVFEAPGLRAMAARVAEARAAGGDDAEPEIAPVDRGGPLPLSFAQERMWFLDRLLPGSAVYTMPFRVDLEGALDAEALRLALQDLVHRHESLRTVFAAAGGRPVQVVTPPAPFPLPVTDLSALPGDAAEREAARRAGEEARRPFDLAAGPLFRAVLLRVREDGWALLLTLHHVVADGWSIDILFRELAQAYSARAAGDAPALPTLPAQYPDYAAWQRARLSGARGERQVAWWRARLAGAPVLELPADRPRPATPSFRGDWVPLGMGPGTADALDALGRAEGATLFHVLLGAFAVHLSRWSGQDDVVVGSPVAGRGRPETEGMVGLFVNTLALRTDLSGDPDFREVVRRVRAGTVDAFAHQEVPFERLVDELRIERSLSRHPLFQVSFSVLPPADPDPVLGTLATRVGESTTGTAKFDLTVQVQPWEGGLGGGLEYAADLFEPETARRLADGFAALADVLAVDPDRPLSRLPSLLSGDERRRVLEEWSGTDAPVAARPIHHVVAEQAARTPDAPALTMAGRTVSYGEMEARANRLAHHLAARGVGPETVVGLVAERAPETVIHTLAILKAGGAYLPLDAAYPAERLRYMLADSGARLVVSPGGLPAGLAAADVPALVDVRAEAEAIGARPSTPPDVAADVEQLAYVIYTSGSTGRPKGVAVPHRGMANLAAWQVGRMALTCQDRVLQMASYSFDAAVADVFPALAAGAALVFAPREALMPGAALLETLRRERVTFATIPPSALAVMEPAGLPDLRVVLSAGEALPPHVAARWAGAVELHNAYGPTEATVSAASGRVDAADVAIGRPIENARAYVLDAAGQPVPPRVPGELHVGGIGVARGYLGRPALTAERFVPDPFGAPGSRLYRTGDRARWRECVSAEVRECGSGPGAREGARADALTTYVDTDALTHSRTHALEFLGRADEQVKVRGFRIEPGEVAARLAEIEGVRDALVLVRPDARGDGRLVAYVAAPERAVSAGDLRAHLRRVLPDYMVPQAYVVMDAFPRTPNGKTDRAALPAPADPAGAPAAAPQGELEVAIAGVWRDVLNLASVGVGDSFFEIGGHSLLVARLQEALREALGREVSMVDLFQYPTVAALAAHLDAAARAEAGGADGAGAEAEKQAGRGRGASRRELLKRGRR